MGLGDSLSSFFGGKNDFHSNVQGPNSSAYQLQGEDANKNALQTYMANTASQAAPQMDTGNETQFRGQQNSLAGQLAATAAGQGTSAADLQLQQGMQSQLAASRAQAASQAGDTNPYLQQRQLGDQMANAMQATNAQAGIQRAQETAQAQQALGNVLSQGRGADINIAQANQASAMNQQAMNQQAQQYGLSNTMNLDSLNSQQQMAYQQAQMQNQQYNNSVNAGVSTANAAAAGKMGESLFQGALALPQAAAAFSDERLKEDIDRKHVDQEMHAFLEKLDPASYEYKDERHGEGRHWGVMAQSAAKSDAGKSFVVPTHEGLALDTNKATSVTLAALAHLNRRIDSLAERAMKNRG